MKDCSMTSAKTEAWSKKAGRHIDSLAGVRLGGKTSTCLGGGVSGKDCEAGRNILYRGMGSGRLPRAWVFRLIRRGLDVGVSVFCRRSQTPG